MFPVFIKSIILSGTNDPIFFWASFVLPPIWGDNIKFFSPLNFDINSYSLLRGSIGKTSKAAPKSLPFDKFSIKESIARTLPLL